MFCQQLHGAACVKSSCQNFMRSQTLFGEAIPFFLKPLHGIKATMMIKVLLKRGYRLRCCHGSPTPIRYRILCCLIIVWNFILTSLQHLWFGVCEKVGPAIQRQVQGIFLLMINGFSCILGSIVTLKLLRRCFYPKRHYRP